MSDLDENKLGESEELLRLVEDYIWDKLEMIPDRLQVSFEDSSVGLEFCEKITNTWNSVDIPYTALLRYCLARESSLLDAQLTINEIKGV